MILWIGFFLIAVVVMVAVFEVRRAWKSAEQPPNLSDVLQAGEGEADKVVADVEAELGKRPGLSSLAPVAVQAAPAREQIPGDAEG